mgnify:CR=1 FL=1
MTTQHSMYMNQLSTLSAGINAAKVQYSHEIATRRRIAGAEFAYSLCTLTEREWRKHVEAVKKGADSIGRVVAAAAWVQPGMENVSALASDPPLDAKTAPDLPEQRYPSEGMNEISTLGSSRFASGSGHGPPSSSLSSARLRDLSHTRHRLPRKRLCPNRSRARTTALKLSFGLLIGTLATTLRQLELSKDINTIIRAARFSVRPCHRHGSIRIELQVPPRLKTNPP